MAFTVQDNDGSVADANAYITVDEFTVYHADRGNEVDGGTADIEQAIVRATTYLDTRFMYKGRKLNNLDQTTEWPRTNCYDRERNYVNGIPRAVKNATAEYALRALTIELSPDPENLSTGQGILEKSEKVDVIEESVKYDKAAFFTMPKYPTADRMLTIPGLVENSGDLRRA